MKIPKPITIDFETERIYGRPNYPPFPCGVSIKYPGKAARYFAWGHPTKNNCTREEGYTALREAWNAGASGDGLLFQNGKFDYEVAIVHIGVIPVPWDKLHDTLFLLYLHNPNERDFGLKSSAHRLLGMPPDEQDAVKDWLLSNQPLKDQGIRITDGKGPKVKHPAAAYISLAPGDLVGKYANGDVIRTEKLFKKLYPEIAKRGMLIAYDRERRLMPVLLKSEQGGVTIDLPRLSADIVEYNGVRRRVADFIKKYIKALDIDINSDQQLLDALINAGKVDTSLLKRTAKSGNYSAAKDSLEAAVNDKMLLNMLRYMGLLNTCLDTFMMPWAATAEISGGKIYTAWNQTKQEGRGGTRTGRLSSSPNFQNVPKFEKAKKFFKHHTEDKALQKTLPTCPKSCFVPPPPNMRGYIIPSKGYTLIDRDYNQQEPRVLAHFDGGELLEIYIADPWTDFHDQAQDRLRQKGKDLPRSDVKTVNLGLIYGMGIAKLAVALDVSYKAAKDLKGLVKALYPGLSEMEKEMRVRAYDKKPIRTWGGREYFCEDPIIKDGKRITFEYKMVNTLIQGSAADCTKEALIRHDAAKDPTTRMLIQVHDEILAECKTSLVKKEMMVLKTAMESVEFDVPMLSTGDISKQSWGQLKPYDKKGKAV